MFDNLLSNEGRFGVEIRTAFGSKLTVLLMILWKTRMLASNARKCDAKRELRTLVVAIVGK